MPWRRVTVADPPAGRPRAGVRPRGWRTEEAAGSYAAVDDVAVERARAVNLPAMEPIGPQLWMTPTGIFHIPGRGTVLTGRLEGQGLLTVGDDLVCDGDHWPVTAIEMSGSRPLKTAEPGSDIGVLLRSCATPDALRGKIVQFVANPGRRKARMRTRR